MVKPEEEDKQGSELEKEVEESEAEEETEESEETEIEQDIWHADSGPTFDMGGTGPINPSLEAMPVADTPNPNLEQQMQSESSGTEESDNADQPTYASSYANATYDHAAFEGTEAPMQSRDPQINIAPSLPMHSHAQPMHGPGAINMGSWQQQATGMQADQDDYSSLAKVDTSEKEVRRGLGRKRKI
jgi:hypothetical protein